MTDRMPEPNRFQKMKADSGTIDYKLFVDDANDPGLFIKAYPDKHEFELSNVQLRHLEKNQSLDWHFLDHTIETTFDVAEDLGIELRKKSSKVLATLVLTGVIAHNRGKYVSYSRNKNGFNGVKGLTIDTVLTAMSALVNAGLVYNFIVPKGTSNRIQSFYCLHPRVLERYTRIPQQEDVLFGQATTAPLKVKLRKKKGKSEDETHLANLSDEDADFSDLFESYGKAIELKATEYEAWREDVRAQNEFLSEFNIGLDIPDDRVEKRMPNGIIFTTSKGRQGKLIEFNRTGQWRSFLRRCKSEPVMWGGRWYGGWWQQLSQADRSCITIDGERVGEEIDIASQHPTLCYDLARTDLNFCPYTLPDLGDGIFACAYEQRRACKVCFFILINAKDHKGSIKAMAKKIRQEFEHRWRHHPHMNSEDIATVVVEAVREHNKPIAEFLSSDVGVKLQYIDSQIMTATQRRCRDLGIPILGVHDSIITLPRYRDKAGEIFFEEYERIRQQLRDHGLQGLPYYGNKKK